MKAQKVEISYKTIIFIFLFTIAVIVTWQLRSLIVLIFLSYILTEGLSPSVNWLQKHKIPRILAICIIYLVIIGVISFSFAGIVPALVEQSTSLIRHLPDAIGNINFWGLSPTDLSSQFKILENLPGNIASTALSVFSNLISVFFFFVITFYLLLERNNFNKYLSDLFGEKSQNAVIIFKQLERRLGGWVNAELLLMLSIGILSYVGYIVIGLNYALPLAIIAGFLELVPNIGPTVATIIAGLFGLTISPIVAIMAIVWGIIVQQLENNFIVPKIMKQTVGLHPLVTILAIAVGAKLGGVAGAALAVPIFLTIQIVFGVLIEKK